MRILEIGETTLAEPPCRAIENYGKGGRIHEVCSNCVMAERYILDGGSIYAIDPHTFSKLTTSRQVQILSLWESAMYQFLEGVEDENHKGALILYVQRTIRSLQRITGMVDMKTVGLEELFYYIREISYLFASTKLSDIEKRVFLSDWFSACELGTIPVGSVFGFPILIGLLRGKKYLSQIHHDTPIDKKCLYRH